MRYDGSCHCGALKVSYESAVPAAETEVRTCQCGFCRRHGSRAISDPAGSFTVTARPDDLQHYRFGLGTADYLLCRHCGVYVAAVMTEGERSWSVAIVNVLDAAAAFSRPPVAVVFDAEDEADRRARRRARWTPTRLSLGD